MSTQVSFRATKVSVAMPSNANSVHGEAIQGIDLVPAVDTLSDAFNNVRFKVTGSAEDGINHSLFGLSTFQSFEFTANTSGLLSVSTHYSARGAYSFATTGGLDSFLLDDFGQAHFTISTAMRVRVVDSRGRGIMNRSSKRELMVMRELSARNASRAGSVEIPPFNHSMTRRFNQRIFSGDSIQVDAIFYFQVIAAAGAEFVVDFSRVDRPVELSDGLNSPLCIVRVR